MKLLLSPPMSAMKELLFLQHNLLNSYQNTAKEGRSPLAPTAHCFIYICVTVLLDQLTKDARLRLAREKLEPEVMNPFL